MQVPSKLQIALQRPNASSLALIPAAVLAACPCRSVISQWKSMSPDEAFAGDLGKSRAGALTSISENILEARDDMPCQGQTTHPDSMSW